MSSDRSKDMLASLLEHRSALSGFLARRLGCSFSAEDILQSIAEKLLLKPVGKSISGQRAYLFRIARNELVNHHRREDIRDKYEARYGDEAAAAEAVSAEVEVEAQELVILLSQALDELPPLTRQIFIMHRIDGLPQRRIAEQLGLNLSTIEKRLALAMRFFRERMHNMTFTVD